VAFVLTTALAGCATAGTTSAVDAAARPNGGRYPRNASRFDVRPQSDTTLRFAPAEVRWVREGLEGIAVDPAQGDALVARFRVLAVDGDSATALVTGQTTRLATGHVALLLPPAQRPWRERAFWWGAAAATSTFTLIALAVLAL
jgi:hypothetical protein